VTLDKRVRDAKNDFLQANHRLGVATTARQSMEKRGYRIDNLVYLHGQGYFGRVKGHHSKQEAVKLLKQKYAEAVGQTGINPDKKEGDEEKPTKTKKPKTPKQREVKDD
jgi:L,D-peptidoglycan transpeptidase YkuD (ErfK/YbiS/YcfS/YnhG family)